MLIDLNTLPIQGYLGKWYGKIGVESTRSALWWPWGWLGAKPNNTAASASSQAPVISIMDYL